MKITELIKEMVNKSLNTVIIGKRGSGKTCLGFELMRLHQVLGKRDCFILKYPNPKILPKFIKNVETFEDVPKNSVLLIDEAGIEFSQFKFNSKESKDFADYLKVLRHNDTSCILITQSGAFLTRDIKRLIDAYFLKEPNINQMFDEAGLIKRLYQNCWMFFKTEKAKKQGAYLFWDLHTAEFYFNKPPFWNEKISTAYSTDNEVENISDIT